MLDSQSQQQQQLQFNNANPQWSRQSTVNITKEQAAELTAPIGTIGVEEAGAVFSQLVKDVQAVTVDFGERTQAVMGKVNVSERNSVTGAVSSTLLQELTASTAWSYFIYNCACKTAVPIFRVLSCENPALLQITGFLATGDSYRAYANDQLILKTPMVRSLGVLTQSFDPSSAMLSTDWSHGQVPIEARTNFTLKIVPRHVTYDAGIGAVRLLPLMHTPLNSRLFVITTQLPYEQAADACAAFDASLAILSNERQVKEVALALNKLPGCPSVWFGGINGKKVVSRLFLLYNPVSEQAVIDRVPKWDSSFREVLCHRKGRH